MWIKAIKKKKDQNYTEEKSKYFYNQNQKIKKRINKMKKGTKEQKETKEVK